MEYDPIVLQTIRIILDQEVDKNEYCMEYGPSQL